MMTLTQAVQQKKGDQNQPRPKGQQEKPVDNVHISPIAGFISALVIVPSSAVNTMNLGGVSGMVSLGQNSQQKAGKSPTAELENRKRGA